MQLARNLYISNERTYERKIREAKVAEEIENDALQGVDPRQVPQHRPLRHGRRPVGDRRQGGRADLLQQAPRRADLREAALLAGLPQAPSLYSPLRSPGAAKARRNDVLREMAKLEDDHARRPPQRTMRRGLGLDPVDVLHAPPRELLLRLRQGRADQGVRRQDRAPRRPEVRTTVDLKKQQEARAAIDEKLGDIGPSSAIVTINPRNGYIVAMASSADYGESKFNLAAQGHRQPGSTFKVMALMAALRAGVDPDSTHYTSRSPFMTEDPKYGHIDVSTYDGSSRGNISLRQATLASDNSVYIQLALDLGPDKVKQAAWDLGIRSKLNGYPAETLGGLEDGVSPLEMANAYATIASGGYRNRPTAITRVTFPDGHHELPARWKVRRTKRVRGRRHRQGDRDPRAEHHRGTGRRPPIGCPAAGKTGTTDEFTDAWFVGFTPRLSTAVWVGYPDRARADDHALLRGPGGRRLVPGGDLGRLHEAGQGQVLRRLQAAQDAVPLHAVLRPSTRVGRRQGSEDDDDGRSTPALPDETGPRRRRGPATDGGTRGLRPRAVRDAAAALAGDADARRGRRQRRRPRRRHAGARRRPPTP